tara:strand:+ start:36 stop:632 length:597 start_codon:yes stop_codon:yes gene_type:complete
MEMLESSKINKLNNFIAGWYIDKKVCDDLINYFEINPNKRPGKLFWDGKSKVIPDKKLSTDLSISLQNMDLEIINYIKELNKVCGLYKQIYEYCNKNQGAWGVTTSWLIQRYKPNEGYFTPHYERNDGSSIKRHLVFMTYLNDVTDGGETEFLHQKFKIKPEKGLSIIWPADWTFTHKGVVSPTQTKYIATGWYEYKG